jgi:hypothetical protein
MTGTDVPWKAFAIIPGTAVFIPWFIPWIRRKFKFSLSIHSKSVREFLTYRVEIVAGIRPRKCAYQVRATVGQGVSLTAHGIEETIAKALAVQPSPSPYHLEVSLNNKRNKRWMNCHPRHLPNLVERFYFHTWMIRSSGAKKRKRGVVKWAKDESGARATCVIKFEKLDY